MVICSSESYDPFVSVGNISQWTMFLCSMENKLNVMENVFQILKAENVYFSYISPNIFHRSPQINFTTESGKKKNKNSHHKKALPMVVSRS